ncbi:MAG TPA: response regulator [Synechococcales cyanobacterium M55_K2018_004]|nr:response regulator [Synechococcales cyanobacterium M55_K2018_004]
MQGKLNEIDIRSILQLIELGQRTGELFVEAHATPSSEVGSGLGLGSHLHRVWGRSAKPLQEQSWFVFFLNGQIIYAGDTGGNLARLQDYLKRYNLEQSLSPAQISPAIATTNAPEYGHLWALLEQHILTPAQGRSIIQGMVQETLFDLLDLHQGSFIFELGTPLAPQLTTFEIAPRVTKAMQQVQAWKQLHPLIQSPEQCPAIANPTALRENLHARAFAAFEKWVDGKTSIRRIARYLHRDILTVARALLPYVQQGQVQLLNPDPQATRPTPLALAQSDRPPRIVCIDDGLAVRKAVEEILSSHGYEATSISNPLRALSLVFQLHPDLILCDISMPELDGYEICAMLRKSTAFRQTPIVMLTGRDGFIDRVRARMVGATDYLTKPFGEGELLTLVARYVGEGNPEHPPPDLQLETAVEDEFTPQTPSESSTSPLSSG